MEQTGRGHGFARMFDRVCAFLDERVGGAAALVAASVITGAFTGVAAMYLVRALRKTGHFPQA